MGIFGSTHQHASPDMLRLLNAPIGSDPATWVSDSGVVSKVSPQDSPLLHLPLDIFALLCPLLLDAHLKDMLPRHKARTKLPDTLFNLLRSCKMIWHSISPFIKWKDPIAIWSSLQDGHFHYTGDLTSNRLCIGGESFALKLESNGRYQLTLHDIGPEGFNRETHGTGSWGLIPDRFARSIDIIFNVSELNN